MELKVEKSKMVERKVFISECKSRKNKIFISILLAVLTIGIILFICCRIHRVELTKKLVDSIKKNNLSSVELILKKNPEIVNTLGSHCPEIARSMDGIIYYPLQWACDCGNYEMVQLLVRYDADVNLGTPSPLVMTLKRTGNSDRFLIAEYLIENGANTVIISDEDEITPLAASLRLSENADENEKELSYMLFTHIVRAYENAGYDIRDEKYDSYDNILSSAARNKNYSAVVFLLENEYYTLNSTNEIGQTVLCATVSDPWRSNDMTNLVEYLLNIGADPYLKDAIGFSAYDYALKYENDMVAELFEHCVIEES